MNLLQKLKRADSLNAKIWPRKPGVFRLRIELPGSIENDYKADPILVSPDDLTKEEAEAMYKLIFEHNWSEQQRMTNGTF